MSGILLNIFSNHILGNTAGLVKGLAVNQLSQRRRDDKHDPILSWTERNAPCTRNLDLILAVHRMSKMFQSPLVPCGAVLSTISGNVMQVSERTWATGSSSGIREVPSLTRTRHCRRTHGLTPIGAGQTVKWCMRGPPPERSNMLPPRMGINRST